MSRRVCFVALALALAGAGCARSEPKREAAPDADTSHGGPPLARVDPALVASKRIVVAAATRRALRGDLRLPAEVVPSESGSAEIGALVAGRIATLEVREGDAVKRGQVLATVDSPEAAQRAADFIRARAHVFAATRKLDRQLGLEQDQATSAAAVDEARVELATATADAAAARTMLASLGMPEPPPPTGGALAVRVPVRSPIDGVLVERTVALGAPVAPDKTLFRVVARDHVVVDARWTDTTSAPPPRDTAVRLLPRGGDGSTACDAKVIATVGVVDERTLARRLRIVPLAPCAWLIAGAYVDASFTSAAATPAPPVLAVPREAVVEVRGAPLVFVPAGPPGTFLARAVKLGRSSAEDVVIEDGLTDGESVVIGGAILLKGELLRAELESQ